MKQLILASALTLLASACTTVVEEEQTQRKEQQYRDTIIVSAEPGFTVFKQQTVCGHPLLEEALRNPQRSDVHAYDAFHEAFAQKFEDLGIHYLSQADDSCDYWMAFALPTSQKLSDEQLMTLFGVSPGLADDGNQDFQRATLMMSLYTAQSNYKMWQVSLQAFAQVETDDMGRRQIAIKPEGVDYAVNRVFAYLSVKDAL